VYLREKQLLVAFGGNQPLGEKLPEDLIPQAAGEVARQLDGDLVLSALYSTPCFPAGAGPDYVNAAALITLRRPVPADAVLQALHEVEARFGRQRTTRWAARTLDIDLLAMGSAVLPDLATQEAWRALPVSEQARRTPDRLILPHPRLQDRGFVLIPLADVAPDWRHPLLGLTVVEMVAALDPQARAEVIRLNPAASA
jgi:2-amino-4-hydroxy-6-hydroxymethyldihydropteridine diphosphokinase